MNKQSLLKIFKGHTGKVSDKWELYIRKYDQLFSSYRNDAIRLLEIGVQNGGSLDIWLKYFPNSEVLVGCDIDPKCGLLEYDDPRISVVIGDANSTETASRILALSPRFEIIIDDGSHKSSDVILSFANYFPRLADNGIYVIEDLHCSYWQEYSGGLFAPHSSVSFLKALADVVHFRHWGVEKSRADIFKGFRSAYGVDLTDELLMQVGSVEFLNSMCVVRQADGVCQGLGERLIVGKQESVEKGRLDLSGEQVVEFWPQSTNEWSSRELPPGEELEKRLQELSSKSTRIDILGQQLDENRSMIINQKQKLLAQASVISHMKSSLSWRLTSPLRALWIRKNFNRKYYLQQNQDVAESGVDPFEHYISCGRREGREPRPPGFPFMPWKFIQSVRRATQEQGGMARALATVSEVMRSEGLSGLKARMDMALNSRNSTGYAEWIQTYDTLTSEDRLAMRKQIDLMEQKPLISVVMPTYNSDITWLTEAIQSVRAQLYENWELSIADDSSTDPELRQFLENAEEDDSRIKVIFRRENGHISRASNTALENCSGEWVALLDHDDILAEHALYCVAMAVNRNPELQLIYSDEDKLDEQGRRIEPYFKCDWNRDLFYSQNLISHLGVFRKKVLDDIGGFRPGFEGSQDYDLALRFIEKIDQNEIHHIPRVLYHWRMHPESTARGVTAKPYAMTAAEKALREHFVRQGVSACVSSLPFGYRVQFALPNPPPLVSLIIPTRNALQLVRNCVSSILEKTSYPNFEILVIDNGSDDPETLSYFETLSHQDNIRILRDERPFNFSRLNNSAVKEASGEIVGFINNDIEVISPEWLSELVSHAVQLDVGAVGAKLLYPDDTVQHAGAVLGIGGVACHAFKGIAAKHPGYYGRARLISSFSAVTAACMLIRKEIFCEVGGFDEDNLTIAFNDVDLCLRIRELGFRNVFNPNALLYHHESATRGEDDTPEKNARFKSEIEYMLRQWGHLLQYDPAYSPNLTLTSEDFSLAWPPRLIPLHGNE